ncbi:nitrogenase component 1 [Methanolobus profundi]|uniref:Nitrogenase iron protein n=1 Tax=Methanolobus profundi TaxID=487685 RepID=A0A1I4PHV0_9EURY|nr:nitrogenase component 1 [Methanolobus profundi]SFM27003.1 nitrogenase iron protein [Methanolobus profundi]
MIQIAIYGKGGIGKSTISANLSATLGNRGRSVLQIGCDPKHDSTRLLLKGGSIATVMEYIHDTFPEQRKLEDILFRGYANVGCIEAGGPEPGVGCAGRGILSTFELLDELGIDQLDFDVKLYDVLGDVVCGGFAVPIRKEYANSVYIVTSGEYMALYAANNILRGLRNFDSDPPRVAGIIHNSRGMENEYHTVKAFADAVGLPIIASIPRMELFAQAEKEGCTVIQKYPTSTPAFLFDELADHVEKVSMNNASLFSADPLTNEEMEEIVLGKVKESGQNKKYPGFDRKVFRHEIPEVKKRSLMNKKNHFFTKNVKNKQPLQGCSFAGAFTVTSRIADALTIVHGPRSCTHIASHFLTSSLINASSRYGTLPSGMEGKALVSTDMDDRSFIFGGTEDLIKCLQEACIKGWHTIFILTTCPSGLIGDDIAYSASTVKKMFPGTDIDPIQVDGNLAGDFSQGIIEGYRALSNMIDPAIKTEQYLVNIIGEKTLSDNLHSNFAIIEELLRNIGIDINCRFLSNTTVHDIKNFGKASLNILAYKDDTGRVLKQVISSKTKAEFFELPFPTGFNETVEWLELIGDRFDIGTRINELIDDERIAYEKEIKSLRAILKGKKVLISSFSTDLDWIIDTIIDLGMVLVKIGMAGSPYTDLRSKHIGILPLEYDYSAEKRQHDIEVLGPDLVLSNYPPQISTDGAHHDQIPFSPDAGFHSGINMARRWSKLLRLPVTEGWKLDGVDVS